MDLDFYQERIVSKIAEWREQEKGRASDAGDMRADIGALLEQTGINKKALSFVRALDKMNEEKRDDVLRTLHPLLEIMDRAWNGNKTPDMFDQEPVEPASEAPRKASYTEDFSVEDEPVDPEIAAEDDAFEKHLASVMPESAA